MKITHNQSLIIRSALNRYVEFLEKEIPLGGHVADFYTEELPRVKECLSLFYSIEHICEVVGT